MRHKWVLSVSTAWRWEMPFLPDCWEKLPRSMSHFLLVWFFSCNCLCVYSSKCHYVQVSAPAIRDHLTFYCDLGLFSWRLLLPQFACWMFHCCAKCQYVCTGEVPVFSSSFLFFSRACPSKPGCSPAAGNMAELRLMQIQSVSNTHTDREGMSTLIVRLISMFLLRALRVKVVVTCTTEIRFSALTQMCEGIENKSLFGFWRPHFCRYLWLSLSNLSQVLSWINSHSYGQK